MHINSIMPGETHMIKLKSTPGQDPKNPTGRLEFAISTLPPTHGRCPMKGMEIRRLDVITEHAPAAPLSEMVNILEKTEGIEDPKAWLREQEAKAGCAFGITSDKSSVYVDRGYSATFRVTIVRPWRMPFQPMKDNEPLIEFFAGM